MVIAVVGGSFIPILVVVAARFYFGCGYFSGLTETWDDCHITQYCEAAFNHAVSVEQFIWQWI
eukprot:94541-Pyramimonas_sp.AAC.1